MDRLAESGGEHFRSDSDWRDLLVHLIDADGGGTIGRVEFQRLAFAFHSPLRRRDPSNAENRFRRAVKLMKVIVQQALSCATQ